MLKELIWIGAGSTIGGMSRFAIGKWIQLYWASAFPLATFSINILGSFLIGLFIGMQQKNGTPTSLHLFLTTGFCGGFTTFSTFSVENMQLIKQGNLSIALGYMTASLVLGLAAVYLGMSLISD